jgi:hypothetical protein
MQKLDHNIGFGENRQFFRRKLAKIAENCDHNIDPWQKFDDIKNVTDNVGFQGRNRILEVRLRNNLPGDLGCNNA